MSVEQTHGLACGDCIVVRNRENNYTFPAVVIRAGRSGMPMARWEAQVRARKGQLTKATTIDGVHYEVAGAATSEQVEHMRALLHREVHA